MSVCALVIGWAAAASSMASGFTVLWSEPPHPAALTTATSRIARIVRLRMRAQRSGAGEIPAIRGLGFGPVGSLSLHGCPRGDSAEGGGAGGRLVVREVAVPRRDPRGARLPLAGHRRRGAGPDPGPQHPDPRVLRRALRRQARPRRTAGSRTRSSATSARSARSASTSTSNTAGRASRRPATRGSSRPSARSTRRWRSSSASTSRSASRASRCSARTSRRSAGSPTSPPAGSSPPSP